MKILSFLQDLFIKGVMAQNKSTGETAQTTLGFNIPSLTYILSFLIRFFFIVAGIIALVFLLLGAFSWITSSGNKESVAKAQDKIQAAVVGLILIAVVLAIVVTLEQFVFNKQICFGISCDLKIPVLLK